MTYPYPSSPKSNPSETSAYFTSQILLYPKFVHFYLPLWLSLLFKASLSGALKYSPSWSLSCHFWKPSIQVTALVSFLKCKSVHVTLQLKPLQWLPIASRINSRLFTLIYKPFPYVGPCSLTSLCSSTLPSFCFSNTRSSHLILCLVLLFLCLEFFFWSLHG